MKRPIIIVIAFNIFFLAWTIADNPTYNEDELQSYVSVCKKIDVRGWYKSHRSTYLDMSDSSEFKLRSSVKDRVITDEFRQAIQNEEVFTIKYGYDFLTGEPTIITLETDNRVYLTLEQWNSVAKKYIIFSIVFIVLIDIGMAWLLIPPDYERMEKKKRKAKLKEKAKSKKAGS